MSKLKQKKVLENLVENGGNVSKAMKKAGYSDAYAKNPQKLENTKSWDELLNEYLPDETLTQKVQEGIEATRTISATVIVKSNDPKVITKQATARDIDFIDVPDFAIRHKYVETALKLKKKFPKDEIEHSGEINIKIKDYGDNSDFANETETGNEGS